MSQVNFKELNETTFDIAWPELIDVKINVMKEWMADTDNIAGVYMTGAAYITFFNKEDAFAFKMRWC